MTRKQRGRETKKKGKEMVRKTKEWREKKFIGNEEKKK